MKGKRVWRIAVVLAALAAATVAAPPAVAPILAVLLGEVGAAPLPVAP